MALDDFKKYHGIALAELLDNAVAIDRFRHSGLEIDRIASSINYLYMVNDSFCLYFKYSTKTNSPWRFTFNEEQLVGLRAAVKESTTMHVVLVAGFECIAVLSTDQLKSIIDMEEKSSQWITVKSFHNRSLRIAGSISKLDHTLSKSRPFQVFLDSILALG